MVEVQHPSHGKVEVVDLDFESPDEEWRDYELEDGTTLKVKTIVNKIYRIEDRYNDLGEPVYEISTQNIVRASDVPEDIKGEPSSDISQELLRQIEEQGTQPDNGDEE